MHVRRLALTFVFAVIACCGSLVGIARADCPNVDVELGNAQANLRSAEPARDGTQADFDRRLGLVASAYAHVSQAESLRSSTPGGCGDIQQVYGDMYTLAWADLLLAFLKPSLDFYVSDPTCKTISHLQTEEIVLDADETMNRSLISWNPFNPVAIANRDHVTRLVPLAAKAANIGLPDIDAAEDFARQYTSQLDALKTKQATDCAAAVTDPNVPKPLIARIFSK